MKSTIIAVSILALNAPVKTQTFTWTQLTANVPSSVRVFEGSTADPLHAWYAEIDYTDKHLSAKAVLSAQAAGKEPTSSIAKTSNAYVAINGGFFDTQSNPAVSYSLVVSDGQLQAKQIQSVTRTAGLYYINRAGFAVKTNRSFQTGWVYHFGNAMTDLYRFTTPINNTQTTPAAAPLKANGAVWDSVVSAIGGGPNLVSDGRVNITYDQEVMFGSGVGLTNPDPRSAIGYTQAGKVILFVVDGRQSTWSAGMSLQQVAQTMIALGCVEAISLDGGGSSTFVLNGSALNKPSDGSERQVASFFAVVPAPTFEKNIDTDDGGYREQGDGWINTGNPGSFGNAARLHTTGSGSNRASFRISVPQAGPYDVFAWWVAAGNRATNTPFVVYSKNHVDTVRLNQTVGGSTWNRLGTYTFAGNTSDSLVITDNASPAGSYIVVDGIRLVSYDTTIAASVEPEPTILKAFTLEQNFPNPFNPSTHVRFSLPHRQFVTLQVFDLLGREVRTLVNSTFAAGEHSAFFEAADLPGGVYFYRLTAGGIARTRRMVLLK